MMKIIMNPKKIYQWRKNSKKKGRKNVKFVSNLLPHKIPWKNISKNIMKTVNSSVIFVKQPSHLQIISEAIWNLLMKAKFHDQFWLHITLLYNTKKNSVFKALQKNFWGTKRQFLFPKNLYTQLFPQRLLSWRN